MSPEVKAMLEEFRSAPMLDYTRPEVESAMRGALERVRAAFGTTYPLVIGGKRITTKDTFPSTNPASPSEVVGTFSKATVEQANQAIEAAERAFPSWSRVSAEQRAEVIFRAAEIARRRRHELNATMVLEVGKSWPEADGDTAEAIDFLEFYAREMLRWGSPASHPLTPNPGEKNELVYIPLGVGVVIPPWNFPCAIAMGMTAATVVTGNAAVLKPSSEAPLTAWKVFEILEEAGVPAGVVNVIPSRSSGTVVSAMLHDPRVRVVSFTGSTEVGRKLLHEAADNVVKPAMELGGNAPFIVFDDADIDAAIEGAMVAKMRNMGEACTAANRFYVHEKVHDEFAKKLTAKMGSLKMGNGLDEGVSLGPLVNKEGLDKVVELVDDAVGKGAKILTGGKATGGKGFFYPATVLANVPDNAKMLNEEIFGPVASLQTFKSEDEVIRRANDTEYGLVAYLYTKDLSRGMRVSEKLDFGMIGLNRGLVSDPAAPFGGMKQSGIGREGAHEGLMEFLETQYVSVNW